MQHPGIYTGSIDPCLVKEEQTASVYAPLMTRIMVSHNSGIPTSKGNPVSIVQDGGIGNTLSTLVG